MLNPCACSTSTMLSMYIANNTSSICFFAKFTDNRAVFLERNVRIKKFNDIKYDHEHLMSGYYLDCVNKKYSKKVQLFDKLEDFRDSLIGELDYIEKINKLILNYEIDMSTFDQKKFDETIICPYCKYKFNEVNKKSYSSQSFLKEKQYN